MVFSTALLAADCSKDLKISRGGRKAENWTCCWCHCDCWLAVIVSVQWWRSEGGVPFDCGTNLRRSWDVVAAVKSQHETQVRGTLRKQGIFIVNIWKLSFSYSYLYILFVFFFLLFYLFSENRSSSPFLWLSSWHSGKWQKLRPSAAREELQPSSLHPERIHQLATSLSWVIWKLGETQFLSVVKWQRMSCHVGLFPTDCRQAAQSLKVVVSKTYDNFSLWAVLLALYPTILLNSEPPICPFIAQTENSFDHWNDKEQIRGKRVIMTIKLLILLARTKQGLLRVLLKEWECGF